MREVNILFNLKMTKQIKLFGGIIIIAAYLVLFFFAAQTIDFYKLLIAGVVSLLSFSFISRFGINEKIVGNEKTEIIISKNKK